MQVTRKCYMNVAGLRVLLIIIMRIASEHISVT